MQSYIYIALKLNTAFLKKEKQMPHLRERTFKHKQKYFDIIIINEDFTDQHTFNVFI